MKTLNTNIFVWLLAVSLSGSALVACAQATTGTTSTSTGAARTASDPSKAQLLLPMQQMMEKLKKLQATGDPDFDYAFQAKIHTQGEQDLLKQEIQNGADSSLKQMAQSLLTVAQSDAALLDETLKQVKPSRPNQAFTQQQGRNIQAMALKLQQGGADDKLTGNFDKNFVTVLLDHRQDAIDMANTYLQYGKNATLKDYAQKLVAKAQTEMTQAKAALPKQN
ncbi:MULTISPECIES: DUF305 domain-containing protein [Spirosoma]|uniref:DUF305 domain-containing protein n=1 Tax=Spirosoma liriopis TaxID=2937440 RepID=A0ABT0HFN0_9BACT|nr:MULTISPECIES: DUF305 domain-containing protein [Spirosoma]MCK8490977.1 DUF305 domain-containing protein [Spirosoma liriopis]UHG90361.1 DUF305 domain-containing protein [Spirosoma oryzicola]